MGYSLPLLRSTEEFIQFQEKLTQYQPSGQWLIQLDMSSTALACGSADIWRVLSRDLQAGKWTGITLTATGNLGIDSAEPMLKLTHPEGSNQVYQHLNRELARRLLDTALESGQLPDAVEWDSV